MSQIKKIILAAHPCRQYNNYGSGWMQSLFEYTMKAVSNLPVYKLFPSNFVSVNLEPNAIAFDYVKFFKFYGITYNKNSWGDLYYNKDYNEEAYAYIKSIFQDSLVISYEMDSCILNILDELGIPYIDMYISPVRFLEDQLFSMTSNFETIYNKLLNYKLDENIIYMQANYLKTFYLMRDGKYIQETPAILFLGQTQYDKSLINNETGEVYSILNHKKEFEESIKGFSRILYKRHPKALGDELVLEYLKTLGDVTITNENFYSLISRPDIQRVVAISSGGLIEAKYFNKETKFLLHESVNLQYGNEFDKEKYINIYEHFFALNFWADVLSCVINTNTFSEDCSFYGSKNKLRNSRGERDYWGYEDFDHEMIKEDIAKNTFLNLNSILTKILRILYHITNNRKYLVWTERL